MVYKYGTLSNEQFELQKKYLKNSIFQMIPYKEEGYKYLDNRFNSLLQQLDGLNNLLKTQSVIISIMSLLEYARHEDNFTDYRKAILDAVGMVDMIRDGD